MRQLFPRGITFFIAFAFLTVIQPTSASGEPFVTDTRAIALGGLQALSHELANPAYLSFQTQKQLGISVSNKYQMNELNTVGCYALFPNPLLNAGIKLTTYGYEDYRLSQIQTGLSKKINRQTALGINLLYTGEISVWEEKTRNRLAASLGVYMQISESVGCAILANNLLSDSFQETFVLHGGADVRLFRNCHFLLEASSNGKDYFNFSSGFEYELSESFLVRGGIRTRPGVPSFGVSYYWKELTVDLAFTLHQTLGTSSSINLSYHF